MTSSRPKHPALAVQDFTQRIDAMDQVDLESLAGWDSFTPDQKRFLAVYPWFGQKKTAAEYIGHNKQWVDRNQRRDKSFHLAVESRLHSPERIARHYGADQIFLGRDPVTGKENNYIETVKGTKTQAKNRVIELEHSLNTGAIIDPSHYTVRELLKDWLRDHAKPNTRVRTYDGYESHVRFHLNPALESIQLHKLQPSHVQKYITDKLESGLSNNTVKAQYRTLSQALRYAVGMQRVGRNVCEAVKPPKVLHTEMNVLDEYQVNDFLDAVRDHRFYNLFHLAVNTGMRRSELLGLRWKDVDGLNIYVTQVLHHRKGGEIIIEEPKTKQSKRRLDIDPYTALELVQYRQGKESLGVACRDDDLIFIDLDGVPFKWMSIYRVFKSSLEKLEIKGVRFHDLRHTHASLMLKQNVNPKIIQERLGHGSIMITMDTYGHLMPNMQKGAVEGFADLIRQAREDRIQLVG